MKINNEIIKDYLNDINDNYKTLEKYNEEDHIKNYLNYWIKKDIIPFEIDIAWGKKENPNYNYENDNYTYDTVLSFWYPLEIYVRYKDKDKKYYYYNNKRVIKKNKYEIRKDLSSYLIPSNEDEIRIYNKLQKLAELSSSRANVMKIPKYKYKTKESFNKYHYQISKDQIWVFLDKIRNDINCKCFKNEIELNEWINEQKLEVDNINIKEIMDPKIDYNNINEFYKEYEKLLDTYINYIEKRQKELK